jgi:hypothetical protein
MTYKIERHEGDGNVVVLRVSGRIRAEYLSTFNESIQQETVRTALDLAEVTRVDREVVPFLAICEDDGIELRNCPPFLREWITREKRRMIKTREQTSESN